MLQPEPYSLVNYTWVPLSQREGGGTGRTRRRQPRRNRTMGPMGGMGMGMGMEGMMGDMGGASRRPSMRENGEFNTDTLNVWAHDKDVVPGGVYSYRLRIGFVNPIGSTRSYHPDQESYAINNILWSKWAVPEKQVKVPLRKPFYVRESKSKEKKAIVDVYVYQNGRWFKRPFHVVPGEMIGAVVKEQLKVAKRPGGMGSGMQTRDIDKREKPTEINVDYRTGAVVVDIIPEVIHALPGRNGVQSFACSDIIYRTKDGKVERIATSPKCWSVLKAAENKNIKRAITRQDKKDRRSGNR